MERILVGYDGSNAGKEALSVATRQANAFDAHLYIIRSLAGSSEKKVEKIKNAEGDLAWAESYAKEKGVSCETHLLVRGLRPGEDLVQFAEENRIDLMVVGVRRRSNVGKIVFGSNARYIVMEAPCPVLTVK
ncbi:MAG: universal stress protein [Desulfococcaceae bacterium]